MLLESIELLKTLKSFIKVESLIPSPYANPALFDPRNSPIREQRWKTQKQVIIASHSLITDQISL